MQNIIQTIQQSSLLFCLVSRQAQKITANDNIDPWQRAMGALVRILNSEYPHYQTLLLDLDAKINLRHDAKVIQQELLHYQTANNLVAYRDDVRYVPQLSSYVADLTPIKLWKAPKAVLITGGLGALGIELATWLAQQGTQYFLMTGTTEKNLPEKIAGISVLEALLPNIIYTVANVTDKSTMQSALQNAEQQWHESIKGVFHLAGFVTDTISIADLTPTMLEKVLAAKVQGTLVLHDLFANESLECFVLFSSTAALPYFGINGLSAYAIANEFLDGFAYYRRSLGLLATSINWSTWADKGMGVQYSHAAFLTAVGMSLLPIKLGFAILGVLLACDVTNIAVLKVDWLKFLQLNADARKLQFFTAIDHQYPVEKVFNSSQYYSLAEITAILFSEIAKLLALEPKEINLTTPLRTYGLDSINAINLIAQLTNYFADTVSVMDIYRYTTIEQLAEFIAKTNSINIEDEIFSLENDSLLNNVIQLSDAQAMELLKQEIAEFEQGIEI